MAFSNLVPGSESNRANSLNSNIHNQIDLTPTPHVMEYIGDEVSAAGYRLCGVNTHIADRHSALSLIEQACKRASLVLIGSSTAQYLRSIELDALMASATPLVLIVPDIRGRHAVPDIAASIHRQLGMLE